MSSATALVQSEELCAQTTTVITATTQGNDGNSVRVVVRVRPPPLQRDTETLSSARTKNPLTTTLNGPVSSHIVPLNRNTLQVVCPPAGSSLFASGDNPSAVSTAVVAAASDVLWEYDSVWGEDSTQVTFAGHTSLDNLTSMIFCLTFCNRKRYSTLRFYLW